MTSMIPKRSRRRFLQASSQIGLASAVSWPGIVRSAQPLSLRFLTIPDPDGWHPSLRLKGDWLVFELSDGRLSGYGEASHSRDDDGCRSRAEQLFAEHYAGFDLSLERLAGMEAEIAALAPDFVTATALSGLNQALYDLLAKREQVPVWRLFNDEPGFERIPLYATINRALQTRTIDEYLGISDALSAQGFGAFKCAPFEKVDTPDNAIVKSRPGLDTLQRLRERFPDLAMRVDFHERFRPADFFELLEDLEQLELDWIEEPFAVGADYTSLREHTSMRIAGGELFWGVRRFADISANAWVDVIMPDVKHVGGFGPLLDVLRMARGRIEVSPHNPSGPISTAASLHAGALFPESVRSLEFAYDRLGTRGATGERVEGGYLYLSDRPGWGVEPPRA